MCVELYRWLIELERIFVLPLAPRWVRHSYLSKEATTDPLHFRLSGVRVGMVWVESHVHTFILRRLSFGSLEHPSFLRISAKGKTSSVAELGHAVVRLLRAVVTQAPAVVPALGAVLTVVPHL